MEIPYHIECILKEKKITTYLMDNGIIPSREFGDKMVYSCPLHAGDKDPSFTVYLNSEYENYFCYGCKSGGNIINLISNFEKISVKKVVRNLIVGMDIDVVDVVDSIVGSLEKGIEMVGRGRTAYADNMVEEIVLKINRNCYRFLQNVNFDKEEVSFFDDIFYKVDEVFHSRDIEALEKMCLFLSEVGIPERMNKYEERQENKKINNIGVR
jgi:hypothetical protein